MQEKQVANLQQYLAEVDLWSTHTRIYRGVADKEFKLIPSLGRLEVKDLGLGRPIPGASLEERQVQYEEKLLGEFKRRALPFLTGVDPVPWTVSGLIFKPFEMTPRRTQ